MATTFNTLWAAGTVTRKLDGKDALLVHATHTGDGARIAVDDDIVIPRSATLVILDSVLSASELVAFKIDDCIAKVT